MRVKQVQRSEADRRIAIDSTHYSLLADDIIAIVGHVFLKVQGIDTFCSFEWKLWITYDLKMGLPRDCKYDVRI